MTGYESIMLLCAIVSTIVTVASFVYAIRKALDKKKEKTQVDKKKAYAKLELSHRLLL